MLLSCIFTMVTTGCWGKYHGFSKITEGADWFMLRLGDVCIPILAAISGMLAAGYLLVGIVAGKFCEDMDGNVMAVVRGTQWSELIESKNFNVDFVMQASAMYYLYGNYSNPFLSMLQAAQAAVHMMADAVQQGESASNLAGDICPGLDAVNSEMWLSQIDKFVSSMQLAVSA